MGCTVSMEDDRAAVDLGTEAKTEAAEAAAAFITESSGLTARVELSFSCSGLKNEDILSKSDPFVVCYAQRDTGSGGPGGAGRRGARAGTGAAGGELVWEEIGRSEIISNTLNPVFVKRVTLNYNFEEVQPLRFAVYDCDTDYTNNDASYMALSEQDPLGTAETYLARIFGSHTQSWTGPLDLNGRPYGTITVKGEELANQNAEITMKLRAEKLDNVDFLSLSDPFVRINKLREDGTYIPTFKTEVKMNNLNPRWDAFSGSLLQLANGDLHRPLKVEVVDWDSDGSHDLIGEVQTSLYDLQQLARTYGRDQRWLPLIHPQKQAKSSRYKNSGRLFCDAFEQTPRDSFLDYIRGGTEISFIVAIDFTASNGDPRMPDSLHHVDPQGKHLNHYAHAILSVGRVLEFYDSDKKFPVYGFGGRCGTQPASHCFALTGDEANPEVEGVDGILNAYYQALASVTLAGPTIFTNIISQAAAIANSATNTQSEQNYYCLLIITDGVINDMDNSVNAIVEASGLPLSVLIVGVGDQDFSEMEFLDSDDAILTSPITNKRMARDIVQFVPINTLAATSGQEFERLLARELLDEIPDQLLKFYYRNHIRPCDSVVVNQGGVGVAAPPAGAAEGKATEDEAGAIAPGERKMPAPAYSASVLNTAPPLP